MKPKYTIVEGLADKLLPPPTTRTPTTLTVLGPDHTWARGGGRGGDAPPLRVKNKSPPLHQKNGYPSQKILDLFYSISPFLGLFYCACLFFLQAEKLQQLVNDWKNHFLFGSKQLISFI